MGRVGELVVEQDRRGVLQLAGRGLINLIWRICKQILRLGLFLRVVKLFREVLIGYCTDMASALSDTPNHNVCIFAGTHRRFLEIHLQLLEVVLIRGGRSENVRGWLLLLINNLYLQRLNLNDLLLILLFLLTFLHIWNIKQCLLVLIP